MAKQPRQAAIPETPPPPPVPRAGGSYVAENGRLRKLEPTDSPQPAEPPANEE